MFGGVFVAGAEWTVSGPDVAAITPLNAPTLHDRLRDAGDQDRATYRPDRGPGAAGRDRDRLFLADRDRSVREMYLMEGVGVSSRSAAL